MESETAPPIEAGRESQSRVWHWIWPVLVSTLVAFVLLPLPRFPLGSDDDSSWAAVLGYAHRVGLQFGQDIIFTHGPLGFLLPPYFSVDAPGWRLCGDVAIAFSAAAGLCLLAWRLAVVWRWVLPVLVVLLGANAEPRSELLLNLGLLAWTLLCLVETGRARWFFAGALTVVAVIGILAKATLLWSVAGCLGVVTCDWALRGNFRSTLALLLGFIIALGLTWLALGQHLVNLGPYLLSAVPVSAGYQAAMGAEQLPFFVWCGAGITLLATLPILLSCRNSAGPAEPWKIARRTLLSGWFILWLFLVWKLGFVRVGRDHIEVFLCFVPMLVMGLLVWRGPNCAARWMTQAASALVCLLCVLCLIALFSGDFTACVGRPVWLLSEHAKALAHPRSSQKDRNELQSAETAAMQLPRLRAALGKATVDVFGYSQSYAVFNELNYRPRPVFQNYAAYTRSLMATNDSFYHSPNAPEYNLFRLEAIDDRFPPLEDAPLLCNLLLNYDPCDSEGPFLLLKHQRSQRTSVTLAREGTVHPGELIDLRDQSIADLWLQIQLEPSWLGRARSLLYQPAKVELGVWCQQSGKLRKADFNAPTPMLATGFLASPLLLENADVLGLYTGDAVTRPVAYSIELPAGTAGYWQPDIRFRLYRVQERLGRNASPELVRLLKFPGFSVAPKQITAATNVVVEVAGRPALFVPPGGQMRFDIPADARMVTGKFGFAPTAYTLGGKTEGAQFRVEEQLSDGTTRLLYSQTLTPVSNPDDGGMKSFSVPCVGEGPRQLVLQARAVAESPWNITCWGEIAFH